MNYDRLGIMQPYFFPYIGYFSLIKHVDRFILFDPVQFIHHGWIERNRVLKQTGGWQYISVPLEKHHRETIIKDIKIRAESDWREKIFAQLLHYKKISNYYFKTMDVIQEGLSCETNSITELNKSCLLAVCKYLNIDTEIDVFSEMNIELGTIESPGDWALRICQALNATEYWNPPGGRNIFDVEKYKSSGIDIKFIDTVISQYNQNIKCSPNIFEPSLSIIDVMMYNSPDEINLMMDNYRFL